MTSENPTEAKRRWRWPRFKLSTILVLVGIAAWAMACRPTLDWGITTVPDSRPPGRAGIAIQTNFTSGYLVIPDLPETTFDNTAIVWFGSANRTLTTRWISVTPKSAGWPLLALAAFLTWKLGWVIVGRRMRRREGMT